MSSLRNKIIRLAKEKPELREHLLPLVKEARTQTYGVAGQEMAGWYVSVHQGSKDIVGDHLTVKKVVQAVEKGWLMGAAKDFAARVKNQLGVLPKVSGHKEHVSIDLEFMIQNADNWFSDDLAFDWLDRWAKKWNLELE